MSGKRVKLRSRREFSEEFKKARIKEYECGDYTVGELSRLYKIRSFLIYRWIHKYSAYNKHGAVIVEMKNSSIKKLKEYEERIAELERSLGQKQLNIDYLQKMIDLAEQEYKIEIKKNSNTPLSNGLRKEGRK